MKEQAQTQLGAKPSNKPIEGGGAMHYLPDDRGIWWCSRLGDVSLCIYDYDEAYEQGVTHLVELTPFVRIHEKCDCLERFNDVRHNDGGWYHSIICLYQITPHIYIATHEDTREAFGAYELRYVVVYVGEEAVGKITLKEGEWAELLKEEEAERLLRCYQEDDNYSVYYEE